MNSSKTKTLLLLLVLALSFLSAGGQELMDPRDRNEDISHTDITVNVEKTSNGLYEFKYNLASTIENKGTILNFLLDTSCDLEFADVELPASDNSPYDVSRSADGKHVPVATFSSSNAGANNVNATNQAMWSLFLKPGESTQFRLLSPTPPRPRAYSLRPYLSTTGWDYDNHPEAPWIPEFTVTGTIDGPGCVSNTEPEIRFAGSELEPFGVNRLLQYNVPTSEEVSLASPDSALEIVIFYDAQITPDTFKARVDGKDISDRFTPAPASYETVSIHYAWKKNSKVHLSVLGTVDDRERGNPVFKSIDNDFFKISIEADDL